MGRALLLDGVRADQLSVTAGRAGTLRIEAASSSWLDRCLHSELAWRTARRVEIVVRNWSPPAPDWLGQLGPVPGLVGYDIRLEDHGAAIHLRMAAATPLHVVLSAVLPVLRPRPCPPAPVSVDIATYESAPAWLPAAANTAGFVGPSPDEEIVRPYDVLLASAPPARLAAGAVEVRAEPSGVIVGGRHTILVDAHRTNPRGYEWPGPGARTGHLLVEPAANGGRWSVSTAGDVLVSGRLGDGLDNDQIAAVRGLASVSFLRPGGADAPCEAAVLAQLAGTGLLVHAPALPAPIADLLADELVAVFAEGLPAPAAAEIEWEIRSVRQRRAALRHHCSAIALPAALGIIPEGQRLPVVSVVLLAERGDDVPRQLTALAAQTYSELEIVLGLPPIDVPAEVAAAVAGCGRRVELVAAADLAQAVALARGTLVTAVDATARYGPEHVWDLILAWNYAGATIVGKEAEFWYDETSGVTVRRKQPTEANTTSVADSAMLVSRGDVEALGGWTPDLQRRALQSGGLVYRTHPFGFVRRGEAPSPHPGPQWTGLPPYPEFGPL